MKETWRGAKRCETEEAQDHRVCYRWQILHMQLCTCLFPTTVFILNLKKIIWP